MATKKLAIKLGLLEKYSSKSLGSLFFTAKKKQEFDYLLVLDFEATCWEGKIRSCEIIEFPVVFLELSTGKLLSEFHQYILPSENPNLSEFCLNLTGIQQSQVDNGIPLATAIALFSRWLRDLSKEYDFSFNSNTPGKHVAFATWTDWDLGVCLHNECTRKQLRKPEYFDQWIDVKLTYMNFYKRIPQGLAGALQDLGIKFQGREHSGIVDARNTATLINKMANNNCVFAITKNISNKSTAFNVKKTNM